MARRLPRLVLGLVICGFGIALMINADMGLGPWDVLHQGVNIHTGIPIGTANILIGALLMVLWIPLRERPGVGTFANMILIGATIDLTLLWLPEPDLLWQQLIFLIVGTFLFLSTAGSRSPVGSNTRTLTSVRSDRRRSIAAGVSLPSWAASVRRRAPVKRAGASGAGTGAEDRVDQG